MVTTRPATRDDLPELVRIYNYYVEHTPITFDVEPFTVEAREPWFDQFGTDGRYRLLVAEVDGGLVGYATSTRLRPKPAYGRSVETSIYVANEHTGNGYGERLYRALFDTLAGTDVHRCYAGIVLPNPASVALHTKLGFARIGTFHEVGYKLDRWWDVEWFER